MYIYIQRQAANAVRYAAKKAKEMKHPYIGTEHLLLGLRRSWGQGQVLQQNGVETEKIMQLMDELIAPRRDTSQVQKPKESPRLRYILANSEKRSASSPYSRGRNGALAFVDDMGCGLRRRKNFDHAEYQPSKTFKRYFKCIGSRSERLSG